MTEAEARIREALATLCDFKGSIVSYDAAEFAKACSPHAIRDVLTVRDEREAALRAEVEALRTALAELVACKDMKDAGLCSTEDEDEYFRRKPAAWSAARAALAQAKDAEARG